MILYYEEKMSRFSSNNNCFKGFDLKKINKKMMNWIKKEINWRNEKEWRI